MDKIDMREWVTTLENFLDSKLRKWKKEPRVENGESIQLRWTWLQTHFHLDIFWENEKETVNLQYLSPRGNHSFLWHGLNDKTIGKICDRVGNLAQITIHPPLDPTD